MHGTLKTLTTLLIFVVFSHSIFSQVATTRVNRKSSKSLYTIKNKFNSHYRINKKLNVDSLLAEDVKEKKAGLPYRFGMAYKADLSLKDGQWKKADGGKLWQLLISSAGAYSINLQFDDFHLAEGTELNIYSAKGDMKMGPFTSALNNPTHFLATDLIKGDSIILELFQPDSVKKASRLHISKIIHAYKPTFQEESGGFGQSAPCMINVVCPAGNGWQTESNAVAMVLLSNGDRWCSGSLVNNSCQDLKAYFLTAFHCLDQGGWDSNNWIFRFQYKSPTCGGIDAPSYYTYNGSTRKASWRPTDFLLLELNQKPDLYTGVTYAGWSRSTSPATSSAAIHHPLGDVMKISIESNVTSLNPSSLVWDQNDISPANTHWVINFDIGGTQTGSSGSPLFDQNHRIVGQLHGGDKGSCPNDTYNTKYYGRFDLSWTGGGTNSTRLSNWLDPTNTIPANGSLNGISIPSVSGNDYICPVGSPGATYSVNNLSTGASVTWSSSPSGASFSAINASTGVFTRYGSGNCAVTASVSYGAGCPTFALTKRVWMGFPPVSYISGPDNLCPSSGGVFTAAPPQSSGYAYYGFTSTYGWTYAPFTLSGSSTSTSNPITLQTPSNFTGSNLVVYAFNACGTAPSPAVKGVGKSGGCPNGLATAAYVLSPNPASGAVSITASEDAEAASNITSMSADATALPSENTKEAPEIKIFDKYLVCRKTYPAQDLSRPIDIRGLEGGVYYLVISDSQRTERHQLVVVQ